MTPEEEARLFTAAVQGMLEGLRDNPSAHAANSISGIASAALAALKARDEEIARLRATVNEWKAARLALNEKRNIENNRRFTLAVLALAATSQKEQA